MKAKAPQNNKNKVYRIKPGKSGKYTCSNTTTGNVIKLFPPNQEDHPMNKKGNKISGS